MRMYRCAVQLTTHIAVEAETLVEAERIIDGCLQAADEVHIHEDGGDFNGGSTLVGSRPDISRSAVRVEH